MNSNCNALVRNVHRLLPAAACLGVLLDQAEASRHVRSLCRNSVALCESASAQARHQQTPLGVQTQVQVSEYELISEQSPPPAAPAPTPTWIQRSLSAVYLTSLPLPRNIMIGDPAFQDYQLKKGIRERQRDEQRLRSLQVDIQKAHQSRDSDRIRKLFEKVTEVAYGKGVTAQIREDFIANYGCTGWTADILDALVQLTQTRGIVEIGAGHGQWARAITEHYKQVVAIEDRIKAFDLVLAYDDMTELPLSTKVYHKHTQPAHDYFFSKVQQCTDDITTVLRQWTCRGRVLMLVYPPPGSMALDTIKAYVEMGPENDTVVYVGEGRGGSTANDALFDYLENGDWALLDVKDVQTQPGGKGYEKLFIFKLQSVSCQLLSVELLLCIT